METGTAENNGFEVYIKNGLQPVRIMAQQYDDHATKEDHVVQFFQPRGTLLLTIYLRVSDEIRIEPVPVSEVED
jgi:hypothetical protein